jgi:hypothetical protein
MIRNFNIISQPLFQSFYSSDTEERTGTLHKLFTDFKRLYDSVTRKAIQKFSLNWIKNKANPVIGRGGP